MTSVLQDRMQRQFNRLVRLEAETREGRAGTKRARVSYAKLKARLQASFRKHPRVAARIRSPMRSNKNPVTRRGNFVVVSGPHSHAYPARKTRIKKRRRNQGMGVSDLVNTPAYGAFGGSIAEGKYNGGPMHWMRRGIRNPYIPPMGPFAGTDYIEKVISQHRNAVVSVALGENRGPKGADILTKGMAVVSWLRDQCNKAPFRAQRKVCTMSDEFAKLVARARTAYMSNRNPLVHGYSRKSFGKNVKRERGRGVSKKRALAIAFTTGRRAAKKAGVRMPKFLRRNPNAPAWEFQVMPYGVTVRHEGRIVAHMKVLPSGNRVWQKLGDVPPRVLRYATNYWKQKYNRNPRYRQSPPGAPSLAASRASNWRSLTTAFPGASISSVTARGNPRVYSMEKQAGVVVDLLDHWVRTLGGLPHRDILLRKLKENVPTARLTAEKLSRILYFYESSGAPSQRSTTARNYLVALVQGALRSRVAKNPRRRKKKRNSGEMSFWRATIYSPTGKPIHRQVIKNTRAGAVASAKTLARTNPKVALDGPFKTKPAC